MKKSITNDEFVNFKESTKTLRIKVERKNGSFETNYNSFLKLTEKFNSDDLDNCESSFIIPSTPQNLRAVKSKGPVFLYFESKEKVITAKKHPVAIASINLSKTLSSLINQKNNSLQNDHNKNPIFSAHVNVGQGCCSFLFNEEYVWAVDCSRKELTYLQSPVSNYDNNIQTCVDFIANYQKKDFHIDTFILTHCHHDHWSGIHFLLNKKYIDKKTDFIYNPDDPHATGFQVQMLIRRLNTLTNLISVKNINQTNIIQFLYPQIISQKQSDSNNSSILCKFNLIDKTFIFPGDLECDGWSAAQSSIDIQNATYFAASHHGSVTGLTAYDFPLNPEKIILMVRNGTYHDTMPAAIFKFMQNQLGNKIISTNDLGTNQEAFFLINLSTGKVTRH